MWAPSDGVAKRGPFHMILVADLVATGRRIDGETGHSSPLPSRTTRLNEKRPAVFCEAL